MERRLTREQFIKRQQKRQSKRREIRKEFFSILGFFAMSYGFVWLMSAIAMIY